MRVKGIINAIEKDRKKRAREHVKYLRAVVVPLLKLWMKKKGFKEMHFFNNDCLIKNDIGEFVHVDYSTPDRKTPFTDKEVKELCEIIDRFQMQCLSDYAPSLIKI